jgi:preprotein translocase subunit YajC
MVSNLLPMLCQIVAQAAEAPADANPADGAAGLASFLPVITLVFLLYFFMFIRPERRKAAAHKAQLDALKKNDRVVTIGGVYGVVMNVEREADAVTLKVDEATNTKIRFTFSSIARVLGDETASDKPA